MYKGICCGWQASARAGCHGCTHLLQPEVWPGETGRGAHPYTYAHQQVQPCRTPFCCGKLNSRTETHTLHITHRSLTLRLDTSNKPAYQVSSECRYGSASKAHNVVLVPPTASLHSSFCGAACMRQGLCCIMDITTLLMDLPWHCASVHMCLGCPSDTLIPQQVSALHLNFIEWAFHVSSTQPSALRQSRAADHELTLSRCVLADPRSSQGQIGSSWPLIPQGCCEHDAGSAYHML